MSNCGVYKITFPDNSFYIGCSVNISNRIRDHTSLLRRNKHKNNKLQEKFNLFKDLNYEVLELCDSSLIYLLEEESIKRHSATLSLNISEGGRGTLPGEKHSHSKTTNDQALEVLEYLVNTTVSHKEIAEVIGVSIHTVNNIAKGATHSWLSKAHPILYSEMLSLKGSRNGNHTNASSIGLVLPRVISPDGKIYSIENIRKFSRDHELEYSGLNKLLHGKQKTTKGWKVYNE